MYSLILVLFLWQNVVLITHRKVQLFSVWFWAYQRKLIKLSEHFFAESNISDRKSVCFLRSYKHFRSLIANILFTAHWLKTTTFILFNTFECLLFRKWWKFQLQLLFIYDTWIIITILCCSSTWYFLRKTAKTFLLFFLP